MNSLKEDKLDLLQIGSDSLTSRLFLGTGKFSSYHQMHDSILNSETQVVTVSLRRIDLSQPENDILPFIKNTGVKIMPNTSGAETAEEALRLALIARKADLSNWIKLEIHPDPKYLLPDSFETFKAAKLLIQEGFDVFPYIQPDPILARKLADIGCKTVMPLAAPIGTNLGIQSRKLIEIIIEQSEIPVIIDAGLGLPSHAAEAMEMGADAVLINTAIAIAKFPQQMAQAFKHGVKAGRLAYLSSPQGTSKFAQATSPLSGFIEKLKDAKK